MNKHVQSWLLISCLCCFLFGCGQSGRLYLPIEPTQKSEAQPSS